MSHVQQDDFFEESPDFGSPLSFRSDITPKLSSLPILIGEVGEIEEGVIARQSFCAPKVEKVLVTCIKHTEIAPILHSLLRILFYSDR